MSSEWETSTRTPAAIGIPSRTVGACSESKITKIPDGALLLLEVVRGSHDLRNVTLMFHVLVQHFILNDLKTKTNSLCQM